MKIAAYLVAVIPLILVKKGKPIDVGVDLLFRAALSGDTLTGTMTPRKMKTTKKKKMKTAYSPFDLDCVLTR